MFRLRLGFVLSGGVVLLIGFATLSASLFLLDGPSLPSASASPFGASDPALGAAGTDASWWASVTSQIEREEYHAARNERGLQAPNRAHNLRTYFREDGIDVVPRRSEEEAAPWQFTWRTSRWGRPGQLETVEAGGVGPHIEGARVTYAHAGLDEWYENKREGLEQGFTVRERPSGEGPLLLVGSLGGGLRPELRAAEGAVDLFAEHGVRVLRYGDLYVWDADREEVPSRLELDGVEVAIVIEDGEADYPLTIDPLMTSPAWTAESDQAGAEFGWSVATAGDVNGDGFSDVIVGAYRYDNGESDEGRAFVYHSSPTGLSTLPAWTAEGNQANAQLGIRVASAGDVNGDGFSDVIVGAYFYDNGEFDEGKAFVYHGSGTGLSTVPAWTAESNQADANFGTSVAGAGDVNGDGFSDVIVGASFYSNGEFAEGGAFVYHGSGAGLSTAPAWTGESNQIGALFGISVAGAGDVNGDGFSDVIVGAYFYNNGQTEEGRAFVYHGSGAGLSTAPVWTAEPDQAGARFGFSVATAGDVNGDGFSDVIVGANLYDNGEGDEGRAFVYRGSGAGLSALPVWTAESNQAAAHFGTSVATAGDVNGDGFSDVIVGAPYYGNPEAIEGRAFVYHGSGAGLSTAPAWTAESNQASAEFGLSVATAGDVNGDGFSDVIVGAHYFDNPEANQGRAYVYHGSGAGLSAAPAWTGESNQGSAGFGVSVATAGDVNGDGYSDVIVGGYLYDNGESEEGRAFVYHGSGAGLAATPAWTAESNRDDTGFGVSVATAGDVNGDGYSDVIIGASGYDNGESNEGAVFVYHGSGAGLAAAPAWTVESNQADAFLGLSVAAAGDVNGDGYSDVILGVHDYDNGQNDEGRAFVYHGSGSGLAATPAWTAEGEQAFASFGFSAATAGDVNGDGFSDVVVAAPRYDNGELDEGRAYVYLGTVTGPAIAPVWTAEGDQVEADFGSSVATAGDADGDGFSDVVVGAASYTNGQTNEGRAFVYHGSTAGLTPAPVWTAESNQPSALFGTSVATAGDVNGDGFSDVIIGADFYDNGETDEGRAFLYYGNEGDGLDRVSRQARTDDSAPIDLLGRSDSESAFRLKALGRTPAGRGKVRLQAEVKPLGIPFDASGLVTGLAIDTGAPAMGTGSAVPLSELASSLMPGTLYHWRLRILTDSPFFPHSRWLGLPGNALTEADVRTGEATNGIAGAEAPATRFFLEAVRPNPFAVFPEVAYTLPRQGHVRLAVYDVTGRERALLADGFEDAGRHISRWVSHELPAGVYFLRFEFGGRVEVQKLVLSK